MPVFYSATGNPEVWDACPDGYQTEADYLAGLPPPEVPTPEDGARVRAMEIECALKAIDQQSTRAIRAILLDIQHEIAPSNEDLAVLAICEDEAMVLRDELAIVVAGVA